MFIILISEDGTFYLGDPEKKYNSGVNITPSSYHNLTSNVDMEINWLDVKYGLYYYISVMIVPNDRMMELDTSYFTDFYVKGKIILGDKYYVFDPKTVKKFNLTVDEEYISGACCKGDVKFLEWWFKSGMELKYSKDALTLASWYGHVDVLEWWIKSNLPLKYSVNALNFASRNGHVNVLEWWFKSGLELKYDENALYWASQYGHVDVLEWWINSGLPLQYSEDALDKLFKNGNSDVLKWWEISQLKLKNRKRENRKCGSLRDLF
jgi:hypothetical protein